MAVPAEVPLHAEPVRQSDGGAPVIGLRDPRDEGFFNPGGHLVHGQVEVPNAAEPVEYSLRLPEKPASSIIHMLVPGFGGFKRSSRPLRDALAGEHGVATLSFEPARQSKPLHDLLQAQRLHADTIAAVKQDLASNKALADTPNGHELDMSQTGLIDHSMGGLAAATHARLHHTETPFVLFMASVGLEEPDDRLRFIKRIVPSLMGELIPPVIKGELGKGRQILEMGRRALRYHTKNPLRTVGEIVSCSLGDIRPELEMLRMLNVKTGLLCFEKDILVPAQSTIEASGHLVDHHEVMPGMSHLAPQTHPGPVAARAIAIADTLLR